MTVLFMERWYLIEVLRTGFLVIIVIVGRGTIISS
jgi:hypothetical protein